MGFRDANVDDRRVNDKVDGSEHVGGGDYDVIVYGLHGNDKENGSVDVRMLR